MAGDFFVNSDRIVSLMFSHTFPMPDMDPFRTNL